jgi:hypothetical protein
MTDRLSGVFVTFERDIREDDARPIVEAIRQLRGVLSVTAHVSDVTLHVAEMRARRELGEKLWRVLDPSKDKDEGKDKGGKP